MVNMAAEKKDEVLMLETQTTNDIQKPIPVPIVEKQDYSGAHEVSQLASFETLY